jgi:broad specificity phosphatase PhoE
LRGVSFAKVFTSPLQRATWTCELAGFGALAEIDRDLLEWNYGEYERRMIPNVGGFISYSPGALSIFFRSRNLMR